MWSMATCYKQNSQIFNTMLPRIKCVGKIGIKPSRNSSGTLGGSPCGLPLSGLCAWHTHSPVSSTLHMCWQVSLPLNVPLKKQEKWLMLWQHSSVAEVRALQPHFCSHKKQWMISVALLFHCLPAAGLGPAAVFSFLKHYPIIFPSKFLELHMLPWPPLGAVG